MVDNNANTVKKNDNNNNNNPMLTSVTYRESIPYVNPEIKINISVLGDRNVGKTTLIDSLIHKANYYIPNKTIGYDIRYLRLKDQKILIRFFDFGIFNYEENVDIAEELFKSSSYIFYVIDYTNSESGAYIDNYATYFKKDVNKKIILFINKTDKQGDSQIDIIINKIKTSFNILNIYRINSLDVNNINTLKESIEKMITEDYQTNNNKFKKMENKYFNNNYKLPLLKYKSTNKAKEKKYCY